MCAILVAHVDGRRGAHSNRHRSRDRQCVGVANSQSLYTSTSKSSPWRSARPADLDDRHCRSSECQMGAVEMIDAHFSALQLPDHRVSRIALFENGIGSRSEISRVKRDRHARFGSRRHV